MTGVQEENKKFLNKINNVLKEHPDYIKGYVNYIHKLSIKTKYNYMLYVINFIEYIDKPIEDLMLDDFSGYIAYIEYKENGELTTPSYRIAVYSALKKFSKYLYATKRISDDFMINIERPKFYENQETIEKRNKGYLTKKEITKLIRTTEINLVNEHRQVGDDWNVRDRAIIQLFLATGIRCSALRKLDLSSINMKNNTLIVTDKGDKVKIYDLPEEVVKIVSEWIYIRNELLKDKEESALFISNRRKRMEQCSIINIVKKYSGSIEGKNITPHKLRATYGTQLYNATGDIYFVQDCMGHNSPKTTELYVRDKKENLKKASSIMGSIIKN